MSTSNTPAPAYTSHKLLVANRGEIAVRILRTAKRLKIATVAVYTRPDATAPHVILADEAVALRAHDEDPVSNARGYLDAEAIVTICKDRGVTLVHPGYGFLSENASFAQMVVDADIGWLGPRPKTIEAMGLKHRARDLAGEVDVPLVPGSQGLLRDVDDAVALASEIGLPVMLKSTAGGGGMGLVLCNSVEELREKFESTQARAQALFHNDGLFIERYYPRARHVEVQVFGDGKGHAIHMGERECSVQRRHQKVIEEAPSPFMIRHPDIQARLWTAAVRLAEHVQYESAGTVEFLVDDATGEFFFLEMNTRLQVEHPVTEEANPGLDIVELMILQGIATHDKLDSPILSHPFYNQDLYSVSPSERQRHAIEVRIYCENPSVQFKPSPGVLQQVSFPQEEYLRAESWVETGTTITSHYDPLACKLIVSGASRADVINRLSDVLSRTKLYGPPNNVKYLKAICDSEVFRAGNATTTFLDSFSFTPRAFTVQNGGLEATVQDYPGRRVGLGMPRSGPMDSFAFRVANVLVGNEPGTEGLELTLTGCRLLFHAAAIVAVTGAPSTVTVDGQEARMWERVVVPAGSKLVVGTAKGTGMRTYVAIRGGFPEIPRYLGSKSTSMGLGGYQGRALTAGDQIALGDCTPSVSERRPDIPPYFIPTYPADWTVYVLPGPQCDPTFITPEGISEFFSTRWTVSASSNRMGIRLEGPQIKWARENGGEGGSHPSNILDNGYAFGTINVNGDTPVILTHEGPDMGGYLCACTVASAELWKLGQLRAGNTVQFKRISHDQAMSLYKDQEQLLDTLADPPSTGLPSPPASANLEDLNIDPRLYTVPPDASTKHPGVVFRQAGDSAILVEFGNMVLDFAIRARIHAFETEVRKPGMPGIWSLAPCIRSTMVHFDPLVVSQGDLIAALIAAEASLPSSVDSLTFPGRRITFPIVLDDRWNREALERYMRSIREHAVYLPSNVEYLARNNGLESAEEALKLLVRTDWLVLGVGFYLACPFLVPIDPRCRLVGQKMNPSRTYTPRGAIGIAGLVAAIYPIESPGGYQLYGRTLPPWQTWGKGRDFAPDRPWMLRPFDQVAYELVSEEEYLQLESQFDAGQYAFKIEERTFSMAEYTAFVSSIADEVNEFRARQARAVAAEEARERELFAAWDRRRREELEARKSAASDLVAAADEGGDCLTSSLTAHVWKIKCSVGDRVTSAEQVLFILEAMKTEVNIEAGEENVGRTVKGFGRDVKEGGAIQAGDVLIYFN
ncbi:urea carboxylase [Polyporus arcularius HHB13444]|uniref:Urea carboxylase n=1 Tax=Polyporus arcularius HHB13444 TaxID=1314778 RepID=A0A5C3NWN4_9APHY|nr:urea carboxylase [Polyporus arcularius HHB13444]